MEAFSLLKYWRGGGAPLPPPSTAAAATPTLLPQNHNATDSDDDDDDEDADGPFFDLEFAVPDEVDDPQNSHEDLNAAINKHSDQEEEGEEEEDDDDDNIEECEREFKFTLSPSSNDRGDEPNLSLSPSEDLFFKGKLVQVDPTSSSSEPNSKPPPPQLTASLFKSATKFRVFRLGGLNKKSKDSNSATSSDSVPKQTESQQKKQQQPSERKHFTVKFKVEEVKIMSLFSRDNSSRGNNKKHSHSHSHNPEESPSSSSEEKRSSKEVMNKYLKMVKPLYIRVSRRYGDKLGFSGHLSLSSASDKPAPPPRDTPEKKGSGSPSKAAPESDAGESTKSEKQLGNNVQAGLKVVCKRLGKSRSASSAAVAAAPAASVSSKRRDDSLLQQQDGIQGAIMHCKRSFNASRSESECCGGVREEVAMLMASALEASRKSTNEGKEKSR